jgi:hypothetical protein
VTVRLAVFVAASMAASASWADELCRYSGSSSHSGHVMVVSKASAANGETTVDVSARVSARSFGIIDWQYLYQEIGVFRDQDLQTVAVNHRYSFAGATHRQLWDLFNRGATGMSAWRVQANSLDSMRVRHPGFVNHWDLSTFGEPWLGDYAAAPPERRADLDLPRTEMPENIGTPLVLGFYWIRWAGASTRTVPVFLPGFKRNARTDITVVSTGVESDGTLRLHSSVRHPQLSETQTSTADAWISPDHHLIRATFDAKGEPGEALGEFHLDGCQGTPP